MTRILISAPSTHVNRGAVRVSEAACQVPTCEWHPDSVGNVSAVVRAARRHADITGHTVSIYTEQALYVEKVKR